MFDQTFVNAQAQTRKPWSVAISLALQTALIAVALIAPLLHTATLDPAPKAPLWLPIQKLDLKLKPEAKASPQQSTPIPRPVFHLAELHAPTTVPSHIDLSPDAPAIPDAIPSLGPAAGASLNALLPEIPIQAAPKPAPQAAPVHTTSPIHIGGDVQAAKLLFGPSPAYPPLARATRTQGTVKLQATIARDGSIRNLQLIGGPPLLVSVAMDAVRQWRYKPTLLNSEPVEVITVIDVNFTLNGY